MSKVAVDVPQSDRPTTVDVVFAKHQYGTLRTVKVTVPNDRAWSRPIRNLVAVKAAIARGFEPVKVGADTIPHFILEGTTYEGWVHSASRRNASTTVFVKVVNPKQEN